MTFLLFRYKYADADADVCKIAIVDGSAGLIRASFGRGGALASSALGGWLPTLENSHYS